MQKEQKLVIATFVASASVLFGVMVADLKGTRQRLRKCQADFDRAIQLAKDGNEAFGQANQLNADMRLWMQKTMEVCQPSPEQRREINEAFDMIKWDAGFAE